MKIHFTKKEYRHLLELLYIADWIVNSHTTVDQEEPKDYSDIIQKVYSYSKQMGCEDLIEHEKKQGKYFPTGKAEQELETKGYIEEFENNTFWEELISRLAERDTLQKYKVDSLSEISMDKSISVRCEAEAKWAKEFEDKGLARIGIVTKA